MENGITNIILEERIKNSLFEKAPEGFTDKLLKEIKLNELYVKEDKKTNKALKYFTALCVTFILGFGTLLLYIITGQSNTLQGNEESVLQNVNEIINGLFTGFLDLLGFEFSNIGFIYVAAILLLIFGFAISEKYIFRKST